MQFLAADCDPISPASTTPLALASVPSLPAAKTDHHVRVRPHEVVDLRARRVVGQARAWWRPTSSCARGRRHCRTAAGTGRAGPTAGRPARRRSRVWTAGRASALGAVPLIVAAHRWRNCRRPAPSRRRGCRARAGRRDLPGWPAQRDRALTRPVKAGCDVRGRAACRSRCRRPRRSRRRPRTSCRSRHDVGVEDPAGHVVEQLPLGYRLDVADLVERGQLVQLALSRPSAVPCRRRPARCPASTPAAAAIAVLDLVRVDVLVEHHVDRARLAAGRVHVRSGTIAVAGSARGRLERSAGS